MGGISGYNPPANFGAVAIQNYAGMVMKNGEQLYASVWVAVPPVYLRNADGVAGPPVLTAAPSWFPAAGPYPIDGQVTTEVPIPVTGADDFIWDSCVISNGSIVPDVAFRFGVWTGPGSTGTNIIPSRGLTLPNRRAIDQITFTPFRMRPDSMYPKVLVANSAPFTFEIAFYARAAKAMYT